jgi:Glu-tRNA(Gln) amidotransferase subunit E-like FAD-binding protein
MRDTEQVLFHLYRIGKTIDEIHQMSEYHPVIIAHYLSDIYFKLKENKIKVESFEVESLTEIVSLYQNGFYNKSRKK